MYNFYNILIAPYSSVSNITFSSVTATSITVSWDEISCFGQNGPITGYFLTYTDITSNTSYTVNITGGDNRTYHLTGLVPYTNYAVSIGAYNYGQQGPDGDKVMQQTCQSGRLCSILLAVSLFLEPSEVKNLTVNKVCSEYLSVFWYPPVMPNGIITVYELHYKESTSNKMYNMDNTTSTQYTIDQLSDSSAIEIKVRGYTIAGAGKWATITVSTLGNKIMLHVMNFLHQLGVAQVQNYSVIPFNYSSVWLIWVPPPLNEIPLLLYYTVHYSNFSNSETINFTNTSTNAVIYKLHSSIDYYFRISMVTQCGEGPFSVTKFPGIS